MDEIKTLAVYLNYMIALHELGASEFYIETYINDYLGELGKDDNNL